MLKKRRIEAEKSFCFCGKCYKYWFDKRGNVTIPEDINKTVLGRSYSNHPRNTNSAVLLEGIKKLVATDSMDSYGNCQWIPQMVETIGTKKRLILMLHKTPYNHTNMISIPTWGSCVQLQELVHYVKGQWVFWNDSSKY